MFGGEVLTPHTPPFSHTLSKTYFTSLGCTPMVKGKPLRSGGGGLQMTEGIGVELGWGHLDGSDNPQDQGPGWRLFS